MSRIRSVHPGLFTDEAWVSCSQSARLLVIGLWTECDDQGIFEWKPLQLKMRLFAADSVDVAAMLAECQQYGIAKRFEHEGKAYGAIRNFCRYQRPRKPKSWFPLPDEMRDWVALGAPAEGDEDDSVPQKSEPKTPEVPAVPKKSELPPQMEDGGGRGEEKEAIASSAAPVGATKRAKRVNPDKPKALPVWQTDPHFGAAWDACPDKMRKRSESREKTWPIWKAAAEKAGGGEALLRALRAYLRGDDDLKRTGGPGFHIWLKEGRWEHWLPKASSAPAAQAAAWTGPAELRNAVVRETNADFSRSYLETCAWRDGALIPRTGYAAEKLRRLRALQGVKILEPQGAAA